MSRLIDITSTGDVTYATPGDHVGSFALTAGVDAATATLRDGGSGGRIFAVIAAPTGTTADVHLTDADGTPMVDQLHATLTGTSPHLMIEIM